MSSAWAAVVIVAIIVWGVVQYAKARAGIISDMDGNERLAPRDDARSLAEIEAARREVSELKERVKVLERIVTDSNTGDAREQARIAAEIEALRALPQAKEEQSK
ncbi:MAG TPA: hypothetical protein VLA50_00295 [Erythrobacter sp.]|nr:hypothetical protein [Erythrobacter sp.]